MNLLPEQDSIFSSYSSVFVTGDRFIEIADVVQSSIPMALRVCCEKPAGRLNGVNNNRHAMANVSSGLHVIFAGNV